MGLRNIESGLSPLPLHATRLTFIEVIQSRHLGVLATDICGTYLLLFAFASCFARSLACFMLPCPAWPCPRVPPGSWTAEMPGCLLVKVVAVRPYHNDSDVSEVWRRLQRDDVELGPIRPSARAKTTASRLETLGPLNTTRARIRVRASMKARSSTPASAPVAPWIHAI